MRVNTKFEKYVGQELANYEDGEGDMASDDADAIAYVNVSVQVTDVEALYE